MKLDDFKKGLQQSIFEKKQQEKITQFEEKINQNQQADQQIQAELDQSQSHVSGIKSINNDIDQKYTDTTNNIPLYKEVFQNIKEAYDLYLASNQGNNDVPMSFFKFIEVYSTGDNPIEEIRSFHEARHDFRQNINAVYQGKKDLTEKINTDQVNPDKPSKKWRDTKDFINSVNHEIRQLEKEQDEKKQQLWQHQYDQIANYFLPEKSLQFRCIKETDYHTPQGIKIEYKFNVKSDQDFNQHLETYGEEFTQYLLYKKLCQHIDQEVDKVKQDMQLDSLQLLIDEHQLLHQEYSKEIQNSDQIKELYQESLNLLYQYLGPDPKSGQRLSSELTTLEKYLHEKYGIIGRFIYEHTKADVKKFLQSLVNKEIDFQHFACSWQADETELESYLKFTPGSESQKNKNYTSQYITAAMDIDYEYSHCYGEKEKKISFLNLTATLNANQALAQTLTNIATRLKTDSIDNIIKYLESKNNKDRDLIDAKSLNHQLTLSPENINIICRGDSPQAQLDKLNQAIEAERQATLSALEKDLNSKFNQAHLSYLKNHTDAEKLHKLHAEYEAKKAQLERKKGQTEEIIRSVKYLTEDKELLTTKIAIDVYDIDKDRSDKKYTIYNQDISQKIDTNNKKDEDYDQQATKLNNEINSLRHDIRNASWWNGLWNNRSREKRIEIKQSKIASLNSEIKNCRNEIFDLTRQNKEFNRNNPRLKSLLSQFDNYSGYFEHEDMKDISKLSGLFVGEILVKIKETIKAINSLSAPEFSAVEKELLEKFHSLEQVIKNNPDQNK
ncbi:MAG: hypothetical protein WC570_01940 [Patescibacteria group bacterium]